MFGRLNSIFRGKILPDFFVNGLNALVIAMMIFLFGATDKECLNVKKIIQKETKRVYCLLKYPDVPVEQGLSVKSVKQNREEKNKDLKEKAEKAVTNFVKIYETDHMLNCFNFLYHEIMSCQGKELDYALTISEVGTQKLGLPGGATLPTIIAFIIVIILFLGFLTQPSDTIRNSLRIVKLTGTLIKSLKQNPTFIPKMIKHLNGVGPSLKRTYVAGSRDDTHGMRTRARETLVWFKGEKSVKSFTVPDYALTWFEFPEAVYQFMLDLPEIISYIPTLLAEFISYLLTINSELIYIAFAILDYLQGIVDEIHDDPKTATEITVTIFEDLADYINVATAEYIASATKIVCSVPAMIWATMLAAVKIPVIVFVNLYPVLTSLSTALGQIVVLLKDNIEALGLFLYVLLVAFVIVMYAIFYLLASSIELLLIANPDSPINQAIQDFFIAGLNFVIAYLTVGIPSSDTAAKIIKDTLDTFRHNLCDTYDQLVTRISELSV